jgi:DNA sulfur modification protein DndE
MPQSLWKQTLKVLLINTTNYMQINIRTLEANQDIVRQLTAKLSSGTKENVIARITFGYSLQKGKKFSTAEFNIYDSKEKSIKTF